MRKELTQGELTAAPEAGFTKTLAWDADWERKRYSG